MANKDNELNEFDNPQEFGDFADGSDLDPIDDADFESLGDDTAFDNDPSDVPPEAIQEDQSKKSSSMFTFIVIGAAVVIGGALIATQMLPSLLGGGDEAPAMVQNDTQTQQPQADPSQQAAQQAVQPQNGQQPVTPDGGLLQNPDQLASLSANSTSLAINDTQSETDKNVFSALNNGQPSVGGEVPMPAPISAESAQSPWPPLENQPPVTAEALPGMPVGNAAPVNTAPVETVMPAQPDTAAPLADMSVAAASAPSGLQAQVDTLSRRLDEMNTKLDAAVQKVEQASAAGNGAAMTSIQETLVRLEKRLDDMASSRSSVRQASVSQEEAAPVRRSTSSTKKAKSARKSSASSTRAASSEWDAPYNPGRSHSTASASASRGGWELRGAQPGSALIAKSGSDDIREVAVGDTLSGIGRVTGITSEGGNWVVQGTSGRISQ